MPELDPSDFDAYFQAVHGSAPFPWQRSLVKRLAAGEGWPALLDLPTGVGKTAALDAAVFHLALEAGATPRPGTAPRRIVFVVDRRTIVDQAFERAHKIARAITDAKDGVLAAVRLRLAALADPLDDEPALGVTMLRGGMPRSDAWARTPDRPLIVISTVDQVGSRLLFRGYGVSDGMRPIHAGLLGNDVLWLLDEVHLSEPFRETLQAVAGRYRGWAEAALPSPFAVVEMSATPGRATTGLDRFGLTQEDQAHETLARRLNARKPTRLVTGIKGTAFASECGKLAVDALGEGARVVGVVVNRVQTARDIAERIRGAAKDKADVALVTGRMRPLDRDAVERAIVPRVRAGRERSDGDRPLVVVATQCIEAGADFDFDALVTECASLDALRQRFGRLDRLGAYGRSQGIIVGRAGDLAGDPVYGDALKATLAWLEAQPALDFGPAHLTLPPLEVLAGLVAPRQHAPILLPAHLDAWVQTAPTPEPDPDVSLWLHGPQRSNPEVQVVWRADLDEGWITQAADDEDALEDLSRVVSAMPPVPAEAMAVPLAAARRWLLGMNEAPSADVEGAAEEDAKEIEQRAPRPALRWWSGELQVVARGAVRPGDTLIVPATYGGVREGNWDPSCLDAVDDLAEAATLRQRGRVTVRLHPDRGLIGGPVPIATEDDDREVVAEWLASRPDDAAKGEYVSRLKGARARPIIVRVPMRQRAEDGTWSAFTGFVLTERRRSGRDELGATTEGEEGTFTGIEVSLAAHLDGVAAKARAFATRVGMEASMIEDVALAGAWHDAGKADPRFQRLLHGGDRFKAEVAEEPIAKSAMAPTDRRARTRAASLSGYPKGARHEILSVAMMERAEALRQRAHDWSLVLHLVASHHGHCRPLAPVAPDPGPLEVTFEKDGVALTASSAHGLERLDSGIGERFWQLVRRYGWWGLAWLEALLRLGDHRRSEEEQRGGVS
ncbi:MAG: type I-U CRISPR-associated helicase/endonuclease Cas3 [Deltaproteobacteria bacterium]|nr:type I-U CRISPR-associated helicase/endonuclease Cas3 [Deltaproteobacteria bacterium]